MSISFVICGLEHSGTTLVSDLFRQVVNLDSGFEVGVLLCESPTQFNGYLPFSDNILEGWGVDKEQFDFCTQAVSFSQFYDRLIDEASTLKAGTNVVFDKTPRYLSQLSTCLTRMDVPFISTYKDPRAVVHSDFKRAGNVDFSEWYESYLPSKHAYLSTCYEEYEKNIHNSRVKFFSLEELALNARESMEKMFHHVNVPFSLDYLLLNGLRFKNTRSTSVSIPIAFSYLADFDDAIAGRIEADFSEFSDWYYR